MVHSPSVHQSALLPIQFSCQGFGSSVKILAHDRLTGATIQYYSVNQLPPMSATEHSAPIPHAYGLRSELINGA